MPKPRTGTVEWVPPKKGEPLGHYRYRITLSDGARPWVDFAPGPASPDAEARVRELAIERSKIARDRELKAEDFGLKPRPPVCRPECRETGDMVTWLHAWITSRKAKGISTRENEAHYKHHIAPATGGKHVRDWTADDFRRLSRELDAKVQAGALKWKTAWNIWGTASRMSKDAVRSKRDDLRVRDDDPARNVAGPDRGAHTSKQYLYPSEFLRFVACDEVPLAWRRLVALAIYLYPRAGELRVLQWEEDVDLEHGTVHVHRARNRDTGGTKSTKTKHARRFNIEPNLLPLLRTMQSESNARGPVIAMPSERTLARALRGWIKRAGVTRTELFVADATRKAITFHDLRATGITWMAIRGDDPLRIQQRAGHEDFTTTQGYIREAEAVRDGFGEVFPSLRGLLDCDGPSASEVGCSFPGPLAGGHDIHVR
ncbi:MAG: site-specific integrase [Polyangiaceae bacterium]